jgi:hypothetical protein
MAWPPGVLPINRTDSTPQQTTHAADHNAANQAINDTVAQLVKVSAGIGTGGKVAGPGGNYAAGTDFITVTIPAAANPRILTFAYNGYVGSQAGQGLDISGRVGGVTVTAYRQPGNGATVQVNLAYAWAPIPANVASSLAIRNDTGTVSLFADALLHNLTYSLLPA